MPLPPERLARLAQLIDELQALPVPARAAWIEAPAAEEADLRPHLLSLRDDASDPASDDAPGEADVEPLDTLWHQAPGRVFDVLHHAQAAEPAAGQRIGPCRLLSLLGRGGMGAVWRAERCDGAFEREVALKLPLQSGRSRPQAW